MRCILCESFSFSFVCKRCQKEFLNPSFSTRVLPCGFKIHSFYSYSDIETLLKTKHTFLGFFIYKILASNSFSLFAKEFSFPSLVYALGIDDHTKSGYSHTAILTKSLKSKNIKPIFSHLTAQNQVNYSGKTLNYRLENPRDFKYTFKKDIDVIIVDDIVTTGTTINEALTKLKKNGVNPLFALTLADARK